MRSDLGAQLGADKPALFLPVVTPNRRKRAAFADFERAIAREHTQVDLSAARA